MIRFCNCMRMFFQVCCPYNSESPKQGGQTHLPMQQPTQQPTVQQPTQNPNSLKNSDLPVPGVCGSSLNDRIVGGIETRIQGM